MNKKTLFWGIIGLVVASGLVYFSERPGDGASEEQVAQLAALTEQEGGIATVAGEESVRANRYESGTLPAASTPGRSFVLELSEGGEATFTADYMNNQDPVVETGTWVVEEGVLTTILETRRGFPISTGPLEMTYEVLEDESLKLVDYDQARWGALGLVLVPAEQQ